MAAAFVADPGGNGGQLIGDGLDLGHVPFGEEDSQGLRTIPMEQVRECLQQDGR